MKINEVKKSRKQRKCQKCQKDILIGENYKYITPYKQPDFIICNKCKFEPWELEGNEFTKELVRLQTLFEREIEFVNDGEELKEIVNNYTAEFEYLRDEQQDKLDNLPEQFQEVGPGEILTNRIEALDEIIDALSDFEFEYEQSHQISTFDQLDKLHEVGDYSLSSEENTQEEIAEAYQELYTETLEECKEDLLDSVINICI